MDVEPQHVAAAVDLLGDIVMHPDLSVGAFEAVKGQLVEQAIAAEDDPVAGRGLAVHRALYGRGYGGQPPQGLRDTLGVITRQDVQNHYASVVAGKGATFAVSGGIDRKHVSEHLRRVFGGFGGEATVADKALSGSSASGKIYLIDYPGSSTAGIAVARRASGGDDAPDLVADDVFNRAFQTRLAATQAAPMRLTTSLRRFRSSGYFATLGEGDPKAALAGIQSTLKQLKALCETKPLIDAERETAINTLIAAQPAHFEGLTRQSLRLSALAIRGWALDRHQAWPGQLRAVTTERANDAAATYCERAELSLVVTGPQAEIKGTDDLGFDPIALDTQGRRFP
jgi:predicted Zn-dependent peptidase